MPIGTRCFNITSRSLQRDGLMRRCACIMGLAANSLLTAIACFGSDSPASGITAFILDGNRMYAQLDFVRPDGSVHQALAFVDMGSPTMALRESLFEELQLDRRKPLMFKVGDLIINVPDSDVDKEPGPPSSIRSQLKVEATLAAGVLQRFRMEIDYRTRTLSLSEQATSRPKGAAIPFQLNHETGLLAVQASIDGASYWLTVDNGSAYTWVRQNVAQVWLRSHLDWQRGTGAVGASNMMMSGDTTETEGVLLRIPQVSLGSLELKDVGALAVGPGKLLPGNVDLFDWYSRKNAVAVIGWIGGNALKAFRLTIDYPHGTMYWLKQNAPDSHDLDQVGLTLRYANHSFVIARVATKNGKATVDGVLPGDRLIKIDELDAGSATWGAIYDALHGKPGEVRVLMLERNGKRFSVDAKVTRF